MVRRGKSRPDDPWTSDKAARELEVSRLEGAVLAALRTAPTSGLTTHEIKDISGIEYGSITPRMVDLEEAGEVERLRNSLGEIMTRIPAGRRKPGIIWRIKWRSAFSESAMRREPSGPSEGEDSFDGPIIDGLG